MTRALVLALLVAGAAACARDEGYERPQTTVRDSAGIRIVENRVPGGVTPVYAELADPDLEIGVVEGDPAYQFTRIAAVRALERSRLLIAESSGLELRVFDGTGTHVRSFGRQGEGPGEFARFTDIGVVGDTILVWDSRQRRATLFDVEGVMLEAVTIGADQMPGGGEEHLWLLADGSWINVREVRALGFGLLRSDAALMRLPPELSPLDTLTILPWQESFVVRISSGGIVIGDLPYGRSASVAVGRQVVASGWNASYRLSYRHVNGRLHTIAVAEDLQVTLDPAGVDDARREREDACEAAWCGEVTDLIYSDEAVPELRPAFSGLLVDALDHVWVAEWEPDGTPVTGWHVFSPDGELLGRVAIPPGLDVHDIGEDFVLGVVESELGVPFVRRHPLARLR